jgi:hypothetical protein
MYQMALQTTIQQERSLETLGNAHQDVLKVQDLVLCTTYTMALLFMHSSPEKCTTMQGL